MIHILEILLFIPVAYSVAYIFCFAIASLLPKCQKKRQLEKQHRFLVIFPAYAEDKVIVDSAQSFLKQSYPTTHYDLVVVSDHMSETTNAALLALPLTTLIATYSPSSKAKALQLTIAQMSNHYNYVVILDADNHVPTNFLEELNAYCTTGTIALQAHRQAKNLNTSVALLDAASEEINNTIFRKAHNQVGLSSALIGSGMCFHYDWFYQHVDMLSTAGEDKELEEHLLLEGHFIHYLTDLPVWDEKVQSGQNFGNQRRRWIAAQLYSLVSLGKRLPMALVKGRINLIDKFFQQMLLPRSICLALTPVLAIAVSLWCWPYGIKWCVASMMLFASLFLALPKALYNKQMLNAILSLPGLVVRMMANLFHLKGAAKNFIHTEHGTDKT